MPTSVKFLDAKTKIYKERKRICDFPKRFYLRWDSQQFHLQPRPNKPYVFLTLLVKWRCLCTHEGLSACSQKLGADIELKVNQNEAVIAEDFKAGKCDGISVSGMRGRQFNSFTGSLDAIGAIPDLKLAVKVMQGLASQTFSKYMVNGRYEVVGVIPVGDAYLLVNDRSINTVAKAAGKKSPY